MKPLPRNKKAPQEIKQDGTSHNDTATLDFQESASLQSQGGGFANAEGENDTILTMTSWYTLILLNVTLCMHLRRIHGKSEPT